MNSKVISKKLPKKMSVQTHLLHSLLLVSLIFLPVKDLFATNNLTTLQKQIKESKSSKSAQTKKQQTLEEEIAKSEQETAVLV
ncbi:hypothetical protein ACLKMH_24190 [Psychromonas sp. KJ10-10]|uniref:hypothetical protein n=1 Tax=Psychromonas sp. KJ10-10 TaxID=3391823 RepID=UPI0039B66075